MNTQDYIKEAQAAARVGAHVAVLYNYRTTADLADDIQPILEQAVRYATTLKKETDRQTVYDWAVGLRSEISIDVLVHRGAEDAAV